LSQALKSTELPAQMERLGSMGDRVSALLL